MGMIQELDERVKALEADKTATGERLAAIEAELKLEHADIPKPPAA